MTREQAKNLAPIIQAYEEGKEIQFLSHAGDGSWIDAERHTWDSDYIYRIKPEQKTRPMTRGEVLYVLTTEHCALKYRDKEHFIFSEAAWEQVTIDIFMSHLKEYQYAIIDKSGIPIDGWHKFEETE